ncbi:MAG TPA: acetylxylan esterase [Gemmatimonadaceae bacterium]|nr:acetylxylan esterase [Gemmatimonadaceae bacterium]
MRSFSCIALVAALALVSSARAQSAPACPARPLSGSPPLSLFAYDQGAALDVRDSLAFADRGVDVYRLTFASPKGGRATALLHVPHDSLRASKRKLPGVVMLHGAPGDAWGMGGIAVPVARQGAIVLVLDAPFARRDKNNPLSFTPRDSIDQVQLLVDLQRAVDVLVARQDVDASRLGYVGVSYGAAIGAAFAGIERRIDAYALMVGDAGIAAHFTQADGSRAPRLPHLSEAQWCAWFAAMEPLSSARFIGRAAPARVLFQWGKQDRAVPPYLAEQLYRAAGETKEARWYESGHALPRVAYLDMIDWMAGQIGIAPVAAAERAKSADAR